MIAVKLTCQRKNDTLAVLSLCLNYLKKPSKPVKFGGFSYVLVYTVHTAVYCCSDINALQRERRRLKKRKNLLQTLTANRLMAEAVRFELTCRLLDNLISSQARYGHFDTPPYFILMHQASVEVKASDRVDFK